MNINPCKTKKSLRWMLLQWKQSCKIDWNGMSLYGCAAARSVACIWTVALSRWSPVHHIRQCCLCFCGFIFYSGVRHALSTAALIPWRRCWKMFALRLSGSDVTPTGNAKHWLDFHPSSLRSASSFFLHLHSSRSREWRQNNWGLLLNSCCNSSLNWAGARWSHDMEFCP